MRNLFLLFFILCSITLISAEKTPTYETIKPVVEGAIKAIEAKDANKLFDNYVSPSDLKELLKKSDINTVKKDFIESEKAGALLFVLKSLEKMDCTYDAKKDTLTFKGKDIANITFSHEGDKWYIKN